MKKRPGFHQILTEYLELFKGFFLANHLQNYSKQPQTNKYPRNTN